MNDDDDSDSDDDTLDAALWLAAGGVAGYAAARWLVPRLTVKTTVARSIAQGISAASARAVGTLAPEPTASPPAPTLRPARALVSGPVQPMPIDPYAGPSGEARPIDPYAGPSGDARPIDPYADPAPSTIPGTWIITTTDPTAAPPSSSPPPNAPASDPATGPITRPSQLPSPESPSQRTAPLRVLTGPPAPARVPRTSTIAATSARVRAFDRVFDVYRSTIPLEYVRALVERESDGLPKMAIPHGAVGLMQIVPVVLGDYNKRHGTTYKREHLVDPAINVAIGCELLRMIVDSYRRNHPRVRNLQADWDNPRFVELLTFGWNAGYSEAGGLGCVARYLEQRGITDITIDVIHDQAHAAGATQHLSNDAKVRWCKSVVALYLRDRADTSRPIRVVSAA